MTTRQATEIAEMLTCQCLDIDSVSIRQRPLQAPVQVNFTNAISEGPSEPASRSFGNQDRPASLVRSIVIPYCCSGTGTEHPWSRI